MKRSLAYYSLLMAVALWVILPACDHKEIVWPDGTPHQVELRFMWDNYPEADPEGMTVYFFPSTATAASGASTSPEKMVAP